MADPERRFRLVVADSSALVALATCRGLPWLERLSREIVAPEAVFREVVVAGKPHAATLRRFLDGRVREVRKEDFVIDTGSLGLGEKLRASDLFFDEALLAEVLALAGE